MLREKMSISERAKIFAPFDALKGFRELLVEQELVKEDRKVLSEDMIEQLSEKINLLKVGYIVMVIHYNEKEKAYEKTIGVLTKIDITYKRITIVKKKINILDLYDIELLEEFNLEKNK